MMWEIMSTLLKCCTGDFVQPFKNGIRDFVDGVFFYIFFLHTKKKKQTAIGMHMILLQSANVFVINFQTLFIYYLFLSIFKNNLFSDRSCVDTQKKKFCSNLCLLQLVDLSVPTAKKTHLYTLSTAGRLDAFRLPFESECSWLHEEANTRVDGNILCYHL